MDFPLYVEPTQSRDEPATPYETKLAALIQAVFSEGHYELTELVNGLNERGSTAPNGTPWTEETFCIEMKRLGA